MTQPARLLRITLLGLFSGFGVGAALLIFARSGLGAVLGDAGFYLVLFGVGWFTGKALHQRLALAERDRLKLSAAFALAYAAGVDPLDALLVEYGLTGVWLLPTLWLGGVTAALAGEWWPGSPGRPGPRAASSSRHWSGWRRWR